MAKVYKIDNIDEDGCLGSTPHYFRIGESIYFPSSRETFGSNDLIVRTYSRNWKMGNLTTVILACLELGEGFHLLLLRLSYNLKDILVALQFKEL